MTATATKTKKNTKGAAGETGDLGLKGDLTQGTQESIDGKSIIKSPPDPLVYERAKNHQKNLDELEDARRRAGTSATELVDAFSKSHKQRFVRIPGKHATYVFTMKTLSAKLAVEKQDKVK